MNSWNIGQIEFIVTELQRHFPPQQFSKMILQTI